MQQLYIPRLEHTNVVRYIPQYYYISNKWTHTKNDPIKTEYFKIEKKLSLIRIIGGKKT